MTTKKTSARKPRRTAGDGMRREYRFDYAKARPNRFAAAMQGDSVTVVLDPDVAAVFGTSERVNALLHSVIAALPSTGRR